MTKSCTSGSIDKTWHLSDDQNSHILVLSFLSVLDVGVNKIIRPVNMISTGNLYIGLSVTSSEVSLLDEELIVIS